MRTRSKRFVSIVSVLAVLVCLVSGFAVAKPVSAASVGGGLRPPYNPPPPKPPFDLSLIIFQNFAESEVPSGRALSARDRSDGERENDFHHVEFLHHVIRLPAHAMNGKNSSGNPGAVFLYLSHLSKSKDRYDMMNSQFSFMFSPGSSGFY